jgi:hypothetical protein
MEMEHQVHPAGGFQGDLPHAFLKEVPGIEKPGQIVEDVLGLPLGSETDYGEAGGLRFGTHDREMLTDEGVEQGGLAHVGGAGEGDVAASGGHGWKV